MHIGGLNGPIHSKISKHGNRLDITTFLGETILEVFDSQGLDGRDGLPSHGKEPFNQVKFQPILYSYSYLFLSQFPMESAYGRHPEDSRRQTDRSHGPSNPLSSMLLFFPFPLWPALKCNRRERVIYTPCKGYKKR